MRAVTVPSKVRMFLVLVRVVLVSDSGDEVSSLAARTAAAASSGSRETNRMVGAELTRRMEDLAGGGMDAEIYMIDIYRYMQAY